MKSCPYDLRDYLLDELTPSERAEVERYLETSSEAREELERLRLTHQALLRVPDEEVPRRIAFVSDKVFERSTLSRFWRDLLAGAPRLAFGMAAMLAVLFAGAWWTQPTLTADDDGWRLAFGPPAAVTTAEAPRPASLTKEQVRAVVREVVAEQSEQQQENLRRIVAEQGQALKAVKTDFEQWKIDTQGAYKVLLTELDEIRYPRSARAELTPTGR